LVKFFSEDKSIEPVCKKSDNTCDNCQKGLQTSVRDVTIEALVILKLVINLNCSTMDNIFKIVTGERNNRSKLAKFYGSLRHLKIKDLRRIVV